MNQPNETWTFKGKIAQYSKSGSGLLFELRATKEMVWLPVSQIHVKKETDGEFDQIIIPRWLIDKHRKLQNEFDEM